MVIKRREEREDIGPPSSSVVEIDHLTCRIDNDIAVDDLSFAINKGVFMGLMDSCEIGRNTILRCLTGLVRPTSGKVLIHGYDVSVQPHKALAHTGSLIGTPTFAKSMTVAELMSYTGRIYGLDSYEINLRSRDVMELVRVWD